MHMQYLRCAVHTKNSRPRVFSRCTAEEVLGSAAIAYPTQLICLVRSRLPALIKRWIQMVHQFCNGCSKGMSLFVPVNVFRRPMASPKIVFKSHAVADHA